jgi:hypothetical protein
MLKNTAFFKLTKSGVIPVKDNLEFVNLINKEKRKEACQYLSKEDDIVISFFKENDEYVVSIGCIDYGLNLTFRELELIYHFIKDKNSKPKIIAQMV